MAVACLELIGLGSVIWCLHALAKDSLCFCCRCMSRRLRRTWLPQAAALCCAFWLRAVLHVAVASSRALLLCVQGREGAQYTPQSCRWFLNWYIWCPVTLTVAGAYNFTVSYQGQPIPSDWWLLSVAAWPGSPPTNQLTQVNPDRAQRDRFTYIPPLTCSFTAGQGANGSLYMWDRYGNRALPTKQYAAFHAQYFNATGLVNAYRGLIPGQPSSYWENVYVPAPYFTTANFKHVVTKQSCSSGCVATANVTIKLDRTVAGKIDFTYSFTSAGTYLMDVTYAGASMHLCSLKLHKSCFLLDVHANFFQCLDSLWLPFMLTSTALA